MCDCLSSPSALFASLMESLILDLKRLIVSQRGPVPGVTVPLPRPLHRFREIRPCQIAVEPLFSGQRHYVPLCAGMDAQRGPAATRTRILGGFPAHFCRSVRRTRLRHTRKATRLPLTTPSELCQWLEQCVRLQDGGQRQDSFHREQSHLRAHAQTRTSLRC